MSSKKKAKVFVSAGAPIFEVALIEVQCPICKGSLGTRLASAKPDECAPRFCRRWARRAEKAVGSQGRKGGGP